MSPVEYELTEHQFILTVFSFLKREVFDVGSILKKIGLSNNKNAGKESNII